MCLSSEIEESTKNRVGRSNKRTHKREKGREKKKEKWEEIAGSKSNEFRNHGRAWFINPRWQAQSCLPEQARWWQSSELEQRDDRFSKMACEKGSDENGISFGYHPGHAPSRRCRWGWRGREEEEEDQEDDQDEDEEEEVEDSEAEKQREAVDRRNRIKEAGLLSCWAH